VKTAQVAAEAVVVSAVAAAGADPVEAATGTASADATTRSIYVIYRFEPNGRCQPFGSIFFLIMSNTFIIREYQPEDFDAVTILWRIAREKSLPEFQRAKGHFFYEDQDYFRDHVLKDDQVFIVESDERPVAFMAMREDFIDHLYVHPDYQHRGIGKDFLAFARKRSPEHIWLYTLQINMNARAFYEKNGFTAEKFGMSPPPESEPDVEYHWRKP
jgi:putative acetyltransferase